ncbi:efflux RND transporter permease subunit [Simkania sp.]|uniref:efflux RND transporter permease subunit n=1 Tax=Simkania sp. TaxID=34094 RepID=UPI003B51E322
MWPKSSFIEPTGNYVDVTDIKQTLIPIPNTNQMVMLSDIAEVYRGYIHPPLSIMHSNGKPSIGLAISLRDNGDVLKMGEEVTAVLKRYRLYYPIGIEFETLAYQPERVVKKIDDFVMNLIQAIIIVCAVMFLFLGMRVGFIVASLIPTVILITFVTMSFIGIGLNQITLASLIIALGMLVDNAIVMAESIIVQITTQNKKPLDAAIQSAKELRLSLLISSLTTCAAFLPFYLAESGTGEYVGSLFLVVTMTLLFSWCIALTMIPTLCIAFIKKNGKKKSSSSQVAEKIYGTYRRILFFMLKQRYLMLGLIVGGFVLAIIGDDFVPKIFYPPSSTPMFTAEIELPVGSSIWRTEDTIQRVEKFVEEKMLAKEEQGRVVSWATFIGNGGPRFRLQHDPEPPNPHYAFMLFTVSNRKEISRLVQELDTFLFENFPDVKPRVRALQEGTPVTNPIEVRITGKNLEDLYELEDKVKLKLGTIAGTKNIDDDWGLKGKKVVVIVDDARAQRANISNADIAYSLESAINGVVLTEFREDDDLIPMVFRSVVARDLDLIGTEAFNVFSQSTGKSVPLLQVADVYIEWQPSIIFRRNRLKTITVMSSLHDGFTANEVETQLIPWLQKESESWPVGYKWELGGENEESGKAQKSIFEKLPFAAVMIVILLLAQFNSLRKTGIILLTIPLSFIGVVFGLLVTQSYFGIMTILGMISLAGIVINNAVVLIDRIRIEQEEENRTPQQAIVAAAVKRFRPILLTTITTTASLIPLWIGGGPLWEPMAITIIFGLMIGTVLTLGVVPMLYSLFFKVSYRKVQYGDLQE